MTDTRKALVVGLGIAGIATALRLRQVGWEPVLVERSPGRRSNGYFVMLFGTGVASARRLGVLDAIGDRSNAGLTMHEIDRAGRRRPGMSPAALPGGPVSCCAATSSAACSRLCRTTWRSATPPCRPTSPRTTPERT
ncbi:hypothetical protein ACFQ0B_37170 [Nonomuraea thailandensis]